MDDGPPIELVVALDEDDLRLDQFVKRRIPGISKGSVQRILQRNLVLVDGRPQPKGHRVRPGEQVVVALAARSEHPVPQPDLHLELLAVQPDLVAIDKPAGMPCHPLVPGETDTVANALVARFPECISASPKAREGGLVHRLDWSTSGVLLAARTPSAYGKLRGMFSSRQVVKHYLALVQGAVDRAGHLQTHLQTMPGNPSRMQVIMHHRLDQGQEAESHFSPLERLGPYSLVEVECRTGRRHQVRVHLAHLGHPLVGDEIYQGPRLEGVQGAFLHASRVKLLADGRVFAAQLPADKEEVLRRLGLSKKLYIQ